MISASNAKSFTNPALMKERFREAAAKATDKHKVIDRLERIADTFLALDGTKHDLDDAPGAVFIGNDKMLVEVQANPFGGILSMEVLDERGPEVKEYKVEPDLTGQTYSESIGGVTHSVYQSGNGLLALMTQLEELAPPDEAEEPKSGEKPKEVDEPKENDKPKAGKPKKSK